MKEQKKDDVKEMTSSESRFAALEHCVDLLMKEVKVHRRQIEVLSELARRDIEENEND